MIDSESLEISPEMLKIVGELDEFKGIWHLLGKLSPDRLHQLRKVATIESVGSSTRIEGAKLSDREVETLLSHVNTYSFRSRDEEEVAGYAHVCNEVFSHFESIPLTENYVKQLHAMLLKYSSKDEKHRGKYKTLPNSVEAFDADGKSLGVIFETTSPFDTPFQMEELFKWTANVFDQKELHPLIAIGMFTVVFLAIHPFQDGNGRLSRVLTTHLLLSEGYAYAPYSSLEHVIEENKEGYYLALRRTQRTLNSDSPDWTPWLSFFLRALQRQKRNLESKVERERLLEANLPELSANILELVQEHGRLNISRLTELTGANRNTIKLRLHELVVSGMLERHGKGRATWYTLATK